MARIVCQVFHRGNRVTFLWSDGQSSFEPYHLEGAEQAKLLDIAEQIHAKLPAGNATEFAPLGHALWRTMLRLDAPDAAASAVHGWLTNLLRDNAVERLQILSDRPGLVPWNLLCDTTGAGWDQFWGTRLHLGVGRRVNALWMNPTLVLPTELGAAGIDIVELLSASDQQLLSPLRDANRLVHTVASLEDDLRKRAPDILLLLVRWAKGRLWLGGDALDLAVLRSAIDETAEGNPEPIVILMGTGAAPEQTTWPTLIENASMHFGGLIANDTLLTVSQALTIGAAIARGLTDGKANLGTILQALRREHGATALAFSAFCPLQVHVSTDPAADAAPPDFTSESHPLPDAPYRPFAAYDATERALFFGRDLDMARAAAFLDDGNVTGMLLHGNPAVGKTSFLQAALIPHLEQENHGYLVLRDRSLQEPAAAEKDYPRLILRATDDLAGQFADALSVFCARPLTYTTPAGTKVTVDLPNLLRRAVTGAAASTAIKDASTASAIAADAPPPTDNAASEALTPRDVWIALRDDKDALGRVLDAITRPLPFELVIAIDQGEELITLARTAQQRERRQKALAMLEQLSEVAPRCKLIVVLRSQAFGQLIGLLRSGRTPPNWRPFCLNLLREDDMADALLWPTNRAAIPFTDEVASAKYGFAFEDGLARRIVGEAVDAAKTARISPLPILQATGALLYQNQVVDKKQNVVRLDDLKAFGGVSEALGKCLDQKIKRLNLSGATADALRGLLARLTISNPDGSVARALVAASDLKSEWKTAGETFEQVVNRAADKEGLVEIQQLLIGGHEDLFVSLPQDSLAQVGARVETERAAQKAARTRVIDMLWIVLPLAFLACAITFWATKNFAGGGGRDDDAKFTPKQIEEVKALIGAERRRFAEARRPLYYGQLARVQQALHAENALVAQQVLMEAPAMRSRDDAESKKGGFTDIRSFEWYYLKKALNSERYALPGHAGVVTAVAVSRDSERAATASIDGTVRIWNLKNAELLALLTGPKTPVNAIAFAPDGKTLASGGVGKLVHLWDLSSLKTDYVEIKKEAKSLKGHTADIHALAYGKDGTLVSAGADKSVIIWDIGKDKEAHTLKEHGAAIHALAFGSDGKTLISAGAEASVIVWDAATGKKTNAIKTGYQTIHALSLSADGKTLSTGGVESKTGVDAGIVRFWQVDGGKEIAPAITHGPGVFAVAFAPDGKSIASAGRDHIVRLFDVASGKQMRRWLGHLGQVNALAFAPDGSVLISGSHDQMAKAWNPAFSSGSDVITNAHDHVQCLALKGNLLVSGGRDGSVKLWDSATGKLLKDASVGSPVVAVALSSHKDKPYLAVATHGDAMIKLFQIEQDKNDYTLKSLAGLTGHDKGTRCLVFSPSAEKPDLLVSGGAGELTVKLWDVVKATELAKHKEPKEVRSVAFTADGTTFAAGGKDGSVCVYDVARPTGVWSASGVHLNSIDALVFGPTDREEVFVITGGADQMMSVTSLQRGEPGATPKQKHLHLRGHAQPITAVLYGDKPDRMFASAGADGAIKLYDTYNETLTLTGHAGPVRALLAAPDQSFLVSAGDDGSIRFWRTAERGRKSEVVSQ